MQLEVVIPDDVEPRTLLSIPVDDEKNVQVRIPDGCGPGDKIILSKEDGESQWTVFTMRAVPRSAMTPRDPESQSPRPAREANSAPQGLAQAAAPAAQATVPPPEAAAAAPTLALSAEPPAHALAPRTVPCISPLIEDGARVVISTSAGQIAIHVKPEWAPLGAARFLDLVRNGHFEDLRVYRAVRNCLVQFGLPTKRHWEPIADDASRDIPFRRGTICFAASGPSSRTGTVFICLSDLSFCLGQRSWETPIGIVHDASLPVLDRFVTQYGDIAECGGAGPEGTRVRVEGNAYLDAQFPNLTKIHGAHVATDTPRGNTEPGAALTGGVTEETPQAQPVAPRPDPVPSRAQSGFSAPPHSMPDSPRNFGELPSLGRPPPRDQEHPLQTPGNGISSPGVGQQFPFQGNGANTPQGTVTPGNAFRAPVDVAVEICSQQQLLPQQQPQQAALQRQAIQQQYQQQPSQPSNQFRNALSPMRSADPNASVMGSMNTSGDYSGPTRIPSCAPYVPSRAVMQSSPTQSMQTSPIPTASYPPSNAVYPGQYRPQAPLFDTQQMGPAIPSRANVATASRSPPPYHRAGAIRSSSPSAPATSQQPPQSPSARLIQPQARPQIGMVSPPSMPNMNAVGTRSTLTPGRGSPMQGGYRFLY